MKSIKEKAAAYDEALNRAKKELDACGSQDCDAARQIFRFFPELKESEDERIVKELLTFFRESMHGGHILTNKEYDSWIAWLEKQGEKVVNEDDRQMMNQLYSWMKEFGGAEEYTEKVYHWLKGLIEKQSEKEHVIAPKFNIGDTIRNKITNEVFTITDRCISLEYYHDINHLHEVKFSEQDNWELVVPKSQRMVSAEAKEAMYNKPAWSEEDNIYIENIILAVEEQYPIAAKEIVNWLKSLKDRVQPKQEWTIHDEEELRIVLNAL